MTNGPITITLDRERAIVLFEFLSRFGDSDRLAIEHDAEQRVLWELEGVLELSLNEPLQERCATLLDAARTAVVADEHGGSRSLLPADRLVPTLAAHDAIWNRWWPALRSLADADAQRAFAGSYPSVFATVQHMVVAEAFWHHRLTREPLTQAADTARDLAALEQVWRAPAARRAQWVERADAYADVSFTLADGHSGSVKVWQCVTHVVSHTQFHLGQVVTLFRLLGLQPPSLDMLGGYEGR